MEDPPAVKADPIAVGEGLIAMAAGPSALVDQNAVEDRSELVLNAAAVARIVIPNVAPNVALNVAEDRNVAMALQNAKVGRDETVASRSVRGAEVFQFARAAANRHSDQVVLEDRSVQ